MSSKHFCLKWNSFQTSILNAFESLQNTEDLSDVTLTCEGINLKAHKIILSACSPYFRTVFKENPCSHPIVILKDVQYTDLIAIINFMYHGEVLIAEDQLSSFIQTARLLQISGLNDEVPYKNTQVPSKKTKQTRLYDTQLEPQIKKTKSPLINKSKSSSKHGSPPIVVSESVPLISREAGLENAQHREFEVVQLDKIKTEDIEEERHNIIQDMNENVEVYPEKPELQGSILEAALEVRDPKPSSILERSLTSQPSGKSPSSVSYQSDQSPVTHNITDLSKAVFIARKPPDLDLERRSAKSQSDSMSPSRFERPTDILQQSIKVEGEHFAENIEIITADEAIQRAANLQLTRMDIQPHHSSQCGNCPHCGQLYSNQSALKYHVRLVHSDLTNMYCCHLCPESFDYREGYKKHMVDVHCIRN